jgi:hypothetical protein
VAGYVVLVPVALFYMLYDWTRLVNNVLELVPPAWRGRTLQTRLVGSRKSRVSLKSVAVSTEFCGILNLFRTCDALFHWPPKKIEVKIPPKRINENCPLSCKHAVATLRHQISGRIM